ncbi:Mediator of RNA polymerase II transcription subunit 23 [Hibiscus syriacus]|uniref:Mediator of RNA polymerase II transcription subunit 23 n=1 Tax=Hibiscus syriacus TaxID=106335 RepID=A0A6A3BS11_HIBSY|nr:Mediator of RNA polymerase II transcription subunit 23 [Hibiscus syriacus]
MATQLICHNIKLFLNYFFVLILCRSCQDQDQLQSVTESVLISLVIQCCSHAPRAEFLLFALRSLCSIGYINWGTLLPSLLSAVASAEVPVSQGSQGMPSVSSTSLSQSGMMPSTSVIANTSNFQSTNRASTLTPVHVIGSPAQSTIEQSSGATLSPVKLSDIACNGQLSTSRIDSSIRANAISNLRQLCCKIILTGLECNLKPVTRAEIFYRMLNWLVNWDQRQQGNEECDGKSWRLDKALIEWLHSCLDVIWLLVEEDKCRVPFYELLRSGLQFIENIPDDEALFTLILEIHRRRDMMAMHMQMLDQHLHCPTFGTHRILPQTIPNISVEGVANLRYSPITYPSMLGEPLHGEEPLSFYLPVLTHPRKVLVQKKGAGCEAAASALLVNGCRIPFTTLANTSTTPTWIVDSGASDHMTGDLRLFHTLHADSSISHIRTADGSLSGVAGHGSIRINQDILLSHVLYDSSSGKVIGSARLCGGFLPTSTLFDQPAPSNQLNQSNKPTKSLQPDQTTLPNPEDVFLPNQSTETHDQHITSPQIPQSELQIYKRRQKSISKLITEPDPESPTQHGHCHERNRTRILWRMKKLTPCFKNFTASVDSIIVLDTVEEALKDPMSKKAVEEELKALENNNTWIIVDFSKDKKPVGCKWVFTVKYKVDGSIERYKARLVAKGFTQSFGVDYHETFAPVAKLNTVRVLLSLAVNENWVLHQLDIKNAFLNGNLEEEVYMRIPPGVKSNTGKACRLLKSLYGLKQSPRAWFDRFTKVIIQDGDDCMEIERLKKLLAKEFETKDLGTLRYFLGMEVARSKEGIVINQRKYILDLLSETGMKGCKPAETPMEANLRLRREEMRSPVNKEQYQRLVVTWRSKKQAMVSRSSVEAKFRAMALGICEGIWIQRMLTELGLYANKWFELQSDSKSAISIAKNPVHHDQTKHVEIDRHFISEKDLAASIQRGSLDWERALRCIRHAIRSTPPDWWTHVLVVAPFYRGSVPTPEINCWQEWLVFSDIFFFFMKSGCIDFVDFIDKLGSRLTASDHHILNTNHVTWLLAQIIQVEHVVTALNTDSRKLETTRKILSFHREDRSSDPNNPQSMLLDFISSCQNLRIWSLNTSTREYLNNEQLQKGTQIDEWWRQVSKGERMMDYMNMDDKSIGMFWVVSYTMAQPACETVMNWLSSGGVTELLPGANVQPNERFMVMREVSPLPISLLSGFSMNLYLKLVFQMEESLFSGQVVPSIAMVETYTRLLLIAPHSLFLSHFSHLAQRNASLLSKPAVTLLVLEIVNYRLLPLYR